MRPRNEVRRLKHRPAESEHLERKSTGVDRGLKNYFRVAIKTKSRHPINGEATFLLLIKKRQAKHTVPFFSGTAEIQVAYMKPFLVQPG